LINEARNKAGLNSLSTNSKLPSAARKHSQDMACNNFFSHTSPTTGSPFDRIRAEGYNFSWAGENIAAGYGSAQATFDAWWNSPAHKDNILGPNFKEIGMGYASLSGSPYGNYATAVFASP